MNKKIRFSKQRRKHDCAAVCVVNACKYYGAKISYYKEYKSLCDILGIENDLGCEASELKELIELSDFPFQIKKLVWSPKVMQIRNHIKIGNAIMLIYDEHVSLLVDYSRKHYTLVNHFSNRTISKLNSKEFEKVLKHTVVAYFLETKELS